MNERAVKTQRQFPFIECTARAQYTARDFRAMEFRREATSKALESDRLLARVRHLIAIHGNCTNTGCTLLVNLQLLLA